MTPPPQMEIEPVAQIGGHVQGVDEENGLVYTGIGPRLGVLDPADPSAPVLLGTSGHLGSLVDDVDVSGRTAFVLLRANGSGAREGVVVVDVSDPAQPVEIGFQSFTPSASDLAAAGSYLYVVLDRSSPSLAILDVGDPANPVLVGSLPLGYGRVLDIDVADSRVYLFWTTNWSSSM